MNGFGMSKPSLGECNDTLIVLCEISASTLLQRVRKTYMRVSRLGQVLTEACAIGGFVMIAATNAAAAGTPAPTTVGKVMPDASLVRPLVTGDLAPSVTVRDIDGKPFNLGTAFTRRPTVLIFYRGGWCPFCNLQMSQLERLQPKLIKMGYLLLAVSMDNPAHLKLSIAQHKLTYTLLSDSDAKAVKAYGLAFHVATTMVQQYKTFHINLDDAAGNSNHILPVPAVYLIGTDHVIRFTYYNPDYKVRLAPAKLLSAASHYKAEMTAGGK